MYLNTYFISEKNDKMMRIFIYFYIKIYITIYIYIFNYISL